MVFGQEARDLGIIAETSECEKVDCVWNLAWVSALLFGLG